jgi:hypothetical protein
VSLRRSQGNYIAFVLGESKAWHLVMDGGGAFELSGHRSILSRIDIEHRLLLKLRTGYNVKTEATGFVGGAPPFYSGILAQER